MSFTGTQQKCKACDKTVYLVDQLTADGVVYHKACFRCHHCQGTLKLSNYASLEGVLYCKPHFDQLFKTTGSFDKSFETGFMAFLGPLYLTGIPSLHKLGTQLRMSSTEHPQTDGQTERVNQILEDMLRAYVSGTQIDWVKHLPLLEFVYNDKRHASTGLSPFELNYGFRPLSPATIGHCSVSSLFKIGRFGIG